MPRAWLVATLPVATLCGSRTDRIAPGRYSLAKFEYWISPGGYVREVLRLSSLLAALLGIPVLMIMPLVTLLFTQVLCWLNLIVTILIDLACIAAALVLGSAMLKIATRSHSHGRPNNRRQR